MATILSQLPAMLLIIQKLEILYMKDLIPAVILSHRLHIPLLMAPGDGCIIIDDIADSGRSLIHYTKNDTQFNKYYIMTLFYATRSVVHPDYYSRVKQEEDWVEFPWEAE